MNHLTMEELTGLREPGLEPGLAAASEHLNGCSLCQGEMERLHQRIARLKALPILRPARNHWPGIRDHLAGERQHRRIRWLVGSGLALAASVALLLLFGQRMHPKSAEAELTAAMNRSQDLEQALDAYHADGRVTDGLTAGLAGALEDRIAGVDRQLEMAQMLDQARRENELLRLWRERVGLLDALVDVHVTRASHVGL